MNATLIIISILFPGIPSATTAFQYFLFLMIVLMIGTCETIRIMIVQQQNQILLSFLNTILF